ncbi:MAG: alanine racemase [Bdellovibrionia bacterium]
MTPHEKLQALLSRRKVTVPEVTPRIQAEMSAQALMNNYRAIESIVPEQLILPMVKANAYGHGMLWAARLLENEAKLYGFGVATLDEAAQLRKALKPKKQPIPILVFSEASHWSNAKGEVCLDLELTPVITSESDWVSFKKNGWSKKLSYEVQFNTGMNRLGMDFSFLSAFSKAMKTLPLAEHPQGVFTHLAISETPDDPLTQSQMLQYRKIKKALEPLLPQAHFHFANSGAIWNAKKYPFEELSSVVRPGLALYGVTPWFKAPQRGLIPVMTVKAQVAAIHRLKTGDCVGYGGTYRVKGREPVYAAVLSAGYADGIHRALGNQGHAWSRGQLTRFLGRVSMDLCTVAVWKSSQVGDEFEILGPHVDPWLQANAAGTIPYELFTALSERVKRVYV